MDFTIDDANFDPAEALPASVKKAIDIIEQLPDGTFFSTRRLAQAVGVGRGTFKAHAGHPALAKYRVLRPNAGRAYLYGNLATIKAFKERYSNEEE